MVDSALCGEIGEGRRLARRGVVEATLAARMFELGWLQRRGTNRSVEVTPLGRARLAAEFDFKPVSDR
jgi:hypothetical protein